MKKLFDIRFMVLITVILLTTLIRFLPHAPNFTPLLAIALFSGAFFENKKLAFIIPFAAMLLSDIFLGFHSTILAVYLSFGIIVYLGILIREKKSMLNVVLTSVSGAVVFYIVTNFAVWLTYPNYTKDFAGLLLCYEAAIPFFRNTLTSTLIFSFALFGSYSLAEKYIPQLKPAPVKIEN